MGYDMYMVISPSDEEDSNYFRANVWGMGMLNHAMNQAGVLDLDAHQPDWANTEEVPLLANGEEDYETQRVKWEEANEAVFSFRSEEPSLVPIAKFGTNDGWHVVEQECLIIADGLDSLLESGKEIKYYNYNKKQDVVMNPDDLVFIKRFSKYCRVASTNGGFKVY